MPCLPRLDIKLLPNHGELEELFPVFHVFQEEEHTELVRSLSVCCLDVVLEAESETLPESPRTINVDALI